ncbi:unnamed protein product [Diamesa tonsa]
MADESVMLELDGNDNFSTKMDTLKVPSGVNEEVDSSDDDEGGGGLLEMTRLGCHVHFCLDDVDIRKSSISFTNIREGK